jgi:metal-responsive CopG/Arc/MetJ family transcriptional regulator
MDTKSELLARLLRNRSKTISIKLNPELVELLERTLKEDKDFSSRNEFFERCILRYLEQKGML